MYNQNISALPTLPSTTINSSCTEDDSSSETSSDNDNEICVTDLEVAAANTETVVKTVIPIYCKNFTGVDILPEIPEEDEIEEERENNTENLEDRQTEAMQDSIKRYSQLSAKFEDLINNDEVESNGYHTVNIVNDVYNEIEIAGAKRQSAIRHWPRCNCCSPYQNYLCKRGLRRATDFLFELLLKPLWSGLCVLVFYPCLLTKVVVTITSVVYIVFIPYIATISDTENQSQTVSAESTMLLSLIAFPWLCLLVFLPWLINSNKSKLKTIFCLGIVTLGISTFRK